MHWLGETTSTNTALEAMWHENPALEAGTLVVTDQQTSGKGRQGRGWETPKGKALAASVLVRGFSGLELSWLPLIAGAAVVQATEPHFAGRGAVGVKWPNDVHMMSDDPVPKLGKKLNGILCQLLGDGSAIVGFGTNLFLTADELPTERAGSWLTEGAELHGARLVSDSAGEELVDTYLARYLESLDELVALAAADPAAVRDIVTRSSATVGTRVRVHLPGGETVTGLAAALEHDGALTLRSDTGQQLTVHAGDVEHVREAPAK